MVTFGMTKSDLETYSQEETERRREAALKRMLATPHKLHKSGRTEARPSRSRKKAE
jgi:hypothetical protein